MARKGENIAVLQFGPSSISLLVAAPSSSGVKIVGQETRRGTWAIEDGTLAEAMAAFAAEHAISDCRIVSVLPRHEATLRVLELPSQNEVELEGMVHLTAEEIVPFPVEELVTSHCVLEGLEDGSSRVLAAVAHQDVVNAHLGVLRAAGLDTEQVFLSTSCLLAALGVAEAEGRQAIVNVVPGGIEVLVAEDGEYVFGRATASDQEWHDVSASGELAAEVQSSLAIYRRETADGAGVDRIVLCGEVGDIADLAGHVSAALGVEVALAPGLLSSVDATEGGGDSAPLVAYGAALLASGRDDFALRLMPKMEVARRAAASTRSLGVRVGAMVAAALLAMVGVYAQAVFQRGAYIAELEMRAEAMRPTARAVQTKRQHLRMLEEQVEQKTSVLELLGGIAALAPAEGLNITRFTYDRDDGIVLRGRALEVEFFDRLIDGLRGPGTLAEFAKAQEMYRTARRERNRQVWDFGISIPFSSEGDGDE